MNASQFIILFLCLFLLGPTLSAESNTKCATEGLASRQNWEAAKDTIPIARLLAKIASKHTSYANKTKFIAQATEQFDTAAIAVIKETNEVIVEILKIKAFFTKLKFNQFGDANHFVMEKKSSTRIELQFINPPIDDSNFFKFNGFVINNKAETIPEAYFFIKNEGSSSMKTKSDSKGYFEFEVYEGRDKLVNLEIYHPNYLPYTDTITLSSKNNYEVIIPKSKRTGLIYMGAGSSLMGLSVYVLGNRKNITDDPNGQERIKEGSFVGLSMGLALLAYGYWKGTDRREVRKKIKTFDVSIGDQSIGFSYLF